MLQFTLTRCCDVPFNWIDYGKRLSGLVESFYKQTYWQRLALARMSNEAASKHHQTGNASSIARRCAVQRKGYEKPLSGNLQMITGETRTCRCAGVASCQSHVEINQLVSPYSSSSMNVDFVIGNQVNTKLGDWHVVIMTHSESVRVHSATTQRFTSMTNTMPDVCQRILRGNLCYLDDPGVGILLFELHDGDSRELSRSNSAAVLRRLGLTSGITVLVNSNEINN